MKDTPETKNFSLSNEEYQQFITWMKGKDVAYSSPLDQHMKSLTEEAKHEPYYNDIKAQITQIQARVDESKKNELLLYKDQIKILLEEEIISRFHLERGSIEVGFKNDTDVKKATEILSNSQQYKKLLNIQ